MKASVLLMFASMAMLIVSFIMLICLVAKEKVFNLHKVWSMAVQGNKLAQAYCVAISAAFTIAVVSFIVVKLGG